MCNWLSVRRESHGLSYHCNCCVNANTTTWDPGDSKQDLGDSTISVKVLDKARRWMTLRKIFSLQKQKGGRGRKMWKCYMGNQGFGIRRVYLEKTQKKRNKLKTGGCVDKTLRPWSLLKCNKYFSRETMHKANK